MYFKMLMKGIYAIKLILTREYIYIKIRNYFWGSQSHLKYDNKIHKSEN